MSASIEQLARSIDAVKTNAGDADKVAKETNSILSIGHQRHYSMLYAHAQEILKSGTLGDIKHIRDGVQDG